MAPITALFLAVLSATPVPGTLTGHVFDETGKPIAGAIVDLYTARPSVGLPTACPSCYRDCAKSTKTDAEGRFSIGELDPILQFRVLVMAVNRRAIVTKLFDPADGELEVTLEPMAADLPVDRQLRGKVVDENGKPLSGAIVWPTGAKTAEKRWWGRLPGVDEATVTDAEGRFVITSEEPKLALDVAASAPGYSQFPAQLFDLEGHEIEIRMRQGTSVTGHLTYQGQPVRNRAIGVAQRDRSTGHFLGETTLATDGDGGFTFVDLQPHDRYVLYSICDGKSELPVLKTLSLMTGGENETTRLGELSLLSGLTLAGRVELPERAKLPAGAKIFLSRDPAWDWCEIPLASDGAFEIRGLPPEVYSFSVVAPGFELDASRLKFQATGERAFGIRLRADRRDIVVPLKPAT